MSVPHGVPALSDHLRRRAQSFMVSSACRKYMPNTGETWSWQGDGHLSRGLGQAGTLGGTHREASVVGKQACKVQSGQ